MVVRTVTAVSNRYTREEFKAALRQLGMRQRQIAHLLELTPGTVAHWGHPRTPFPPWLPLLMAAWIDNQQLRVLHRDGLVYPFGAQRARG